MTKLMRRLTALFLFFLPLLILPWNTGYSYTKSAFAIAMISLLLALWSVEMQRRWEQSLHLTKLFYPGLALIIVALLSLINASSLGIGLQSLVLLVYFFLFYLFLANFVAQEHDVHLFLGSILAAAFLAATYGVLQYYGLFPETSRAAKGTGAIISTFGNKNFLGGFLVYLVLPALILPFRTRSWILRSFSLLALGTIIYALTLIKSDGAWVALAASGAFFTGGFLYFKLYRTLKLDRGRIIMGAIVLILGIGLSVTGPLTPRNWNSFNRSGGSSSPQEGLQSSRLTIPVIDNLVKLWQKQSRRVRAWDWWIGWEMLKDYPLTGVGLGHYKIQFLPYKAEFLASERGRAYDFYILRAGQAHNEYVQIAAEMGIPGILAGGFALFMIFFGAFKRLGRLKSPQDKFIALALLSGLVAVLIHALVSFPLHLPASALDFILLLGLLNSRYLTPKEKEIELTSRRAWIVSTLIVALVATTLAFGVRDFRADVHLQRGKLLLSRGDDRAAERELQRSIALDFQPQSNLFYLGGLYAKQGRYRESLPLFQRSFKCYVIETTYWYLGTLNLALGNYDAALEHLALLAAIDPSPKLKKELPRPLGNLYDHAVALLKAGEEEEAKRWFDTLAKLELLEQDKRLEADYFRAMISINQGQFGEGIVILEQLIAKEPEFWRAYVGLGGAYERMEKVEVARSYYEQALLAIDAQLSEAIKELEQADKNRRAELEAEIELLREWKTKIERLLEAGLE